VRVGVVHVGCVGEMLAHTDPQSHCLSIEGTETPGQVATVMRMQRFVRTVWLALLQLLGVHRVAASAQDVWCSDHL